MSVNLRKMSKKVRFAGLTAMLFVSPLAIGFPDQVYGADEKKLTTEDLKTPEDRISYGIGLDVSSNLKMQEIPVDIDLFVKGFKDGLAKDGTPLMTQEEVRKEIMAFQQKKMEKMAETNKINGEKFLSENKEKEGVVTLPSGLQYKVIKQGEGATPKETDKVSCHYKGTTLDGTEFDSSYKRDKPATFAVNQIIKGWKEALQIMKVGDKWKLFIPSELAYGQRGAGQRIGPNETLVFEIELLGIEEAEKAEKVEKAEKPKKAEKAEKAE